jgi:disulfide oxidoreductase YuzD
VRFGDAVKVEYVDLADAEAQAQFADLMALVEDRDLPYPLVAINGQLRLAGTAHYYQVLPYVEEALQIESTMSEA